MRVTDRDISVQRHAVDGFTLCALVGDQLVQRRFIGYSVREAKRIFRNEVNKPS